MSDSQALSDRSSAPPFGDAKTPEQWVSTAEWWIRELGGALPEAQSLFKALVATVKERQAAAEDADRRSCQGGWRLAQERAVAVIHTAAERDRLRAEVERLKVTPFVVDDRYRDLLAEVAQLRAGISHVRGMCTDEEPHHVIDAKLGEILYGD